MLFTIAKPRPVPVCSGFSCENGWKSWFCGDDQIPSHDTIQVQHTLRKLWLMPCAMVNK